MAEGASGDRTGGGTSRLGTVPADLGVVVVLLLVADVVVLTPVLNESPLRVVLGILTVLVLPGYAVVAALFPASHATVKSTASETVSGDETRRGIDGIERAALSVALSIPVVALAGLGLSLTPLGVGLGPVLVVLNAVILGTTALAVRRRMQLPATDRFRVPYREWSATGRHALASPASRKDLLLNVAVAVSVVLAAGSVTYAIAAPNDGEAFTEFYLLTENETGALVADDYPTDFTIGESRPIVVGIENHEHRPVEYTVVGQLQRVRTDGTTTRVLETVEFDRFTVEIDDNATWRQERSILPSIAGERLRVVYLLYRGPPPADPSISNAYRSVHLWITVHEVQSPGHNSD